MPIYLVLATWTEQGRREAASLPQRAAQIEDFFSDQTGGMILGHYITLGRYDEVALVDVPDEEALVRFLFFIAGRGYIATEALRCFSLDQVRELL